LFAPVAVAVYVVVAAGETLTLPAATFDCGPTPLSMVSELALLVVQLSVEELPATTVVGVAENDIVGAGGVGGAGVGSGGADGCTLPPPQPSTIATLRIATHKKIKRIAGNDLNALTSCIELGMCSSGLGWLVITGFAGQAAPFRCARPEGL
jgi:hypothetical protein